MEYKLKINGKIPSKSNCYRIITLCNHASLKKTDALKKYEQNFFLQNPHRDIMISGFFKLDVDVYYENMRPDLDNSFKVLLDCLQSCHTIKNDRQCVEIHARKLIDKDNPRIEATITTI